MWPPPYVLGIDFGGTKVAIGVGDADGHLIVQETIPTRDYASADQVVAAAIERGHHCVRQSGPIAAVGIATMGITTEAGVQLAPNVPGWDQLHLPSRVRDAFPGCPVAWDNDVKAALRAELRWGSLRGASCAAYLNLGTGIALAFSAEGRVWRGAHGAAGEIAYAWEPGERGYGDGHAPLEERWGGGALDRLVREQLPAYAGLAEACRHRDADRAAYVLVEQAFRALAEAVGKMLLVIDVDIVAVGGGMAAQFAWLAPQLEAVWTQYLPFPPRCVCSAFPHQAGLRGALAVGLEDGDAP